MGYIQTRYRRRISAVGTQTARLRGDVARVLVDELRKGTQEELYDRTPLPVTHNMMRSIRPVMQGNLGASVGYTYGPGANYAKYRVNMTGISVLGGHVLDMRMGEYLRKNADPRIRKLARAAQKRILEAG